MNYGSVASGIEAATVAWHPLGWRPQFFAQFDPEHDYRRGVLDFPSTVLKHHYPDVPNYGDMTKFRDWPDANIDVLVGGTPCQTYSVAGLGAGLDDPRGNLMLTYVAIARRYRPTWVAWENVPGVLSNDRGRSFASLLACLSGQRIDVPSGGWRTAGVVPGIRDAYGLAWRVLDTQYVRIDKFGRAIPQRRRRVIVVGYLGDYRRAAAVFLEPEGLSRDTTPRRYTTEGAAPTLAGGARKSGGYSTDDIPLIADVAGTLTSAAGRRGGIPQRDDIGALIPAVANPLTARMFKGVNTTMDEGQTMVPSFAFKESHFTRGKDGAPSPVAFPLSADADKGDQDNLVFAPEVAACLTRGATSAGKGGYAGRRQEDDHNIVAVPVGFNGRQDPIFEEGIIGPLDTDSATQCVATPSVIAYPLTAEAGRTGKGDSAQCVVAPGIGHNSGVAWRVRRLMPIECERLQGFEDGYTDVMWRGKPAADGPRYKALGNTMSVNVMRWIGRRIELVSKIQ